jgi:4-coumarate--CoA ligase
VALFDTLTVIFEDAETKRFHTFADTKEAALAFGGGLKALWNWKKGDLLAIFSPNCIDTPLVTWGTHWAGGVVSPSNPAYTVHELTSQLKNAGAKALVTQLALLPVAKAAAANAGIPDDRVILIGDDRDPTAKAKHFTSIKDISATRYRKTKVNPKTDVAFLVYSSGTTGLPKGVMLSHTNIVANILQNNALDGRYLSWNRGPDGKGDRLLSFLPFFHIYGKALAPGLY